MRTYEERVRSRERRDMEIIKNCPADAMLMWGDNERRWFQLRMAALGEMLEEIGAKISDLKGEIREVPQ